MIDQSNQRIVESVVSVPVYLSYRYDECCESGKRDKVKVSVSPEDIGVAREVIEVLGDIEDVSLDMTFPKKENALKFMDGVTPEIAGALIGLIVREIESL